jgi:hypothetical protein
MHRGTKETVDITTRGTCGAALGCMGWSLATAASWLGLQPGARRGDSSVMRCGADVEARGCRLATAACSAAQHVRT